MNQRSSPIMPRWKIRLVVRRGRIGIGGEEGVEEGREREKRREGGAKIAWVPVSVLYVPKLDQQ